MTRNKIIADQIEQEEGSSEFLSDEWMSQEVLKVIGIVVDALDTLSAEDECKKEYPRVN